MLTEDLKRVAK